jgi:hypothetical protein
VKSTRANQGTHEHMCSYVELDPMEQKLLIALVLPSIHVSLQFYFSLPLQRTGTCTSSSTRKLNPIELKSLACLGWRSLRIGDLAGSYHFNTIWDMFEVLLDVQKIQIFSFSRLFHFLSFPDFFFSFWIYSRNLVA